MKRFSETIGLVAALFGVGGALHALNRFLAHYTGGGANPELLVYLTGWSVELGLLSLSWFALLSLRLSRLPNDAKRMGVWIDSRQTILDIKSATESVNTMVLQYGIRRTEVHHLRIWTGPGPADASRESPRVKANGLPQDHSFEQDIEDIGNRRYYNVRFCPPLKIGWRPLVIELRITERTHNQYYMFQDEIPKGEKNEFIAAGCDYYKQRVVMPTKLAVLQVIFPLGFVPTGRSYFQVRVAETETPVPSEERRLRSAVAMSRNEHDRRILTATVRRPVLGATYVLLWRPPERQQDKGGTFCHQALETKGNTDRDRE